MTNPTGFVSSSSREWQEYQHVMQPDNLPAFLNSLYPLSSANPLSPVNALNPLSIINNPLLDNETKSKIIKISNFIALILLNPQSLVIDPFLFFQLRTHVKNLTAIGAMIQEESSKAIHTILANNVSSSETSQPLENSAVRPAELEQEGVRRRVVGRTKRAFHKTMSSAEISAISHPLKPAEIQNISNRNEEEGSSAPLVKEEEGSSAPHQSKRARHEQEVRECPSALANAEDDFLSKTCSNDEKEYVFREESFMENLDAKLVNSSFLGMDDFLERM